MKKKRLEKNSLLAPIIFGLSLVYFYGFGLTDGWPGTQNAGAAAEVINWNIGTDGDLLITDGGGYYVTGSTSANTITVNTGEPVSITLDNVSIDVSGTAGKCAFDSGADVTLWLKGANSLKSGDFTLAGVLGQPGLKVQDNEVLLIYEFLPGGLLTATGGNRGAGIGGEGGKDGGSVTIESGTVRAVGGIEAAGIGGGGFAWTGATSYSACGGFAGLLTVNGGAVTATGGLQGAGIGSGAGDKPGVDEKGEIRINGGMVTVVGGEFGAAIGGGRYRSNSLICINGGTVMATGGTGAAGVGGGYLGSGGTVTIKGGELTAGGGGLGAGIGGGQYGSGADVEVENATVSARGGENGAGIGSGAGSIDIVNAGTINIISGTVTATGGSLGAGIGGGWRNNGAAVTINGGTVIATGGAEAAGIGGGQSIVQGGGVKTITQGGSLTVNDGEVKAYGGQYSAGIGGSYWGSSAEVVINSGRVEAYGSGWGAGIGGGGYSGIYGTLAAVTINGGNVKAVGGEDAAGIGGGYLQPGGTVIVCGGEVVAQGGKDGAGIGGGREKEGGAVTISDGCVAATGGSSGAGIGGGIYGFGGTVTISNGTITATGGTGGSGIGGGFNGAGGNVTITGGSIKAAGNNADDVGGSGGAKGTGTLTNGTEPLEKRIMENYVDMADPKPVNIHLTVTRSTPYDYAYAYNYTGRGHGAGDANLYFYLPVRLATTLSLTGSQNPSTYGDTVILTAELGSVSATGMVKFFNGDVLLGTATLNNGLAVFETSSLLPGTHALKAQYEGDEFYAPTAAVGFSQTVNKLPTSVTLGGDPNPAAIGAAVTFTAGVEPAAASGQVKFYDGETLINALNLAEGKAILTTDSLALGTHLIKAAFQGDEHFAAAESNVVEQEITKVPTSIMLTSSRNPSAFGETVVFTATVDPLSAPGSVDYYDNGTWLGRTPIMEGKALFATYYTMTLGVHSITAKYAGTEVYAPCTADAFEQTVKSGPIGDPAGKDAKLAALSASGVSLTPEFNSEIISYRATAKNNVSATTITAAPIDQAATVKINGFAVNPKEITLRAGENLIAVQVTAADGVTTAAYTIRITRESGGSGGGGGAGGGGSSGSGSGETGRPSIAITTEQSGGFTTNQANIKAEVDSGRAAAFISNELVTALLNQADLAKGHGDLLQIVMDTPDGINQLQVSITQTALARIGSQTNAHFGIASPFISIAFDGKAVGSIAAANSAGTVLITARQLADLNGRPAYTLSITNGEKEISGFNGGQATVTIPYTLKPGENPDAVVIYCQAGDGQLTAVRGHYAPDKKAVVFKTCHFSKFIIGYNPVNFSDVPADAWYKNAVDFIAARGITTGTGNQQFSPGARLSKGQFVVLLLKAYGITPEQKAEFTQAGQFSDAGQTYYTDYLLVAKGLGIIEGIGSNRFAPENAITRQEMLAMLYNALKVLNELPAATNSRQLSNYQDAAQVAAWAHDAMNALLKAGVISGSDNRLSPVAHATRAEISQVLFKLLSR